MASLNDLYAGLMDIASAITMKGGKLQTANKSPSLRELKNAILSIPVMQGPQVLEAGLVVTEVANTTINVYSDNGELVATTVTDATIGGSVSIIVPAYFNYRVTAINSNGVELWTKTIFVNEETVICKPGRLLNDFTDEEIFTASENGYAPYMFDLFDFKVIPFMGTTSATDYTKARILGFNHDEMVEGGKAGIT